MCGCSGHHHDVVDLSKDMQAIVATQNLETKGTFKRTRLLRVFQGGDALNDWAWSSRTLTDTLADLPVLPTLTHSSVRKFPCLSDPFSPTSSKEFQKNS